MIHSDPTERKYHHFPEDNISLKDLFSLEELQNLQELFSAAYGVSSVITYPDGTPVTSPNNFCRLCKEVIRGTEKGREFCHRSETSFNESGAKIKPCLGGSLWEAGANITVGNKNLGNWLIGQTRSENLNVEHLRNFSDEIGVKKEELIKALEEVPVMSSEKFEKVSQMLFTFARELSERAYVNLELRRQSAGREKALKLLKKSEERFHSLFDNLIEAVAFHELIYNELGEPIDYRIVETNLAFQKQFELDREDLMGKTGHEIFGLDSLPFLETFVNVIRSGNPVSFAKNFELLHRYFSISVYKTGENEFSTIYTDITKAKKTEEKIKHQNEKLQKINAEKDKFFSIIAHDLKSPFNAIIGFSELLEETMNDNDFDREEVKQFARIISSSSNKVVDLLSNLMEWSLSQTGRLISHPVEFNLKELVTNISQLFKESSNKKSIKISTRNVEVITVFSDKEMIGTIIRNLVSNALKFTPNGGKITISTIQEPMDIRVTVKDTGVGIPENIKDQLFTFGENSSTAGTLNEEGTGLGLIICKEFVEKLSGEIWVESEVGKGSEFTFTIPIVKSIKHE